MEEPEKRELLKSALPLLAIVLMASGIVVKTVPLGSKRPADPEHAKFSHAGLQDVEARLWEDPFGAMRHIKGSTPGARCTEAIEDEAHYPYTLSNLITFVSKRAAITVLPVLLQGGPYFENGESRRRARYAVVTALLNAEWVPSDADKMGYVWTFENCVEAPWARRVPELLPYEWFEASPGQPSPESDAGRRQRLLVLWVDEDAVSRAPLRGVEQLGELLAHPETLCDPPPVDEKEGESWLANQRQELATKLKKHKDHNACPKRLESNPASLEPMRVIGPSTSTLLQNVVSELAFRLVHEPTSAQPDSDSSPTRFYSATATAVLGDGEFSEALKSATRRPSVPDSSTSPQAIADKSKELADQIQIKELKKRFDDRIVRLTTTDDKLVDAFVTELGLRLRDQTPWHGLVALWQARPVLCDDTIVIVSEGDTPYARFFRDHFSNPPKDSPLYELRRNDCGERVVPVSYLRGLDGVLPTGTGAPAPATPQQAISGGTDARATTITDLLPDQAILERADGRSQYDYLRRLGEHLIALDRRERQGGHRGVTAIVVLGNDTYDKLLVLDALRGYFPRAVFFAADLDARLIGREVRRSTRNLVVASAYGLKLRPDLQLTAPPFRDTYQTGIYLATRVALDAAAQKLSTHTFEEKWFKHPRLFEIGRTRAVPLSQVGTGNTEACKRPDPDQCQNIQPDDEWRGFVDQLPDCWAVLAVVVMALTAAVSALRLSDRAYTAVRNAFTKSPRWGVLVVGIFMTGLFAVGLVRD